MINKIVLASRNTHKLEEFQSILNPLGIQVIGAVEAGLGEVDENGTTFEENALLKARSAYAQVGLPVLADDSGLCIHALHDAPGLCSARFATEHGGYPAVFDTIWDLLKDKPDWSAHFTCCLVMKIGPMQSDEHVFIGKMEGKIAPCASGTHLFGYDPIFIPNGYEETCGVLDPQVKNKISHRANALKKLTEFLKNQ